MSVKSSVLLVSAVTAAFLSLHVLLWSAQPEPGLWVAGSVVLAALWGLAFMRLITRGEAR